MFPGTSGLEALNPERPTKFDIMVEEVTGNDLFQSHRYFVVAKLACESN